MAWVLSHALARVDVDETHAIFGQARILLKEGDITDAEGAGVTNTRRAIDITIKVGFCTRAYYYFHTLNQKMDLFILIWMMSRFLCWRKVIVSIIHAGVTNIRKAIDITIKVGFCTRAYCLSHNEPELKTGSIFYSFILIWIISRFLFWRKVAPKKIYYIDLT